MTWFGNGAECNRIKPEDGKLATEITNSQYNRNETERIST